MRASRKEGFTLVELLIVIAIIALLAGISLVALRSSRSFVGAAVARQQIDDIGQAIEIYRQKYGEYPPDCTASDGEIQRHILKRWPNALKSRNMSQMVSVARDQMGIDDDLPAKALLFWLAGMDQEGFLADDRDPIAANPDPDEPRETPVIELKYDSEGNQGGNYNEQGFMFNGAPIIYFRAEGKNGYDGKGWEFQDPELGTAVPYKENPDAWYNPDSFQLIYAGEDGSFGDGVTDRDLSDSSSLNQQDHDNVTNFSGGATLESMIE